MKRKHVLTIALLTMGLILVGGVAAALSPATVVKDVVASSGGPAESEGIALVDTVGQPVVGISSAGPVGLQSGFWAGGVAHAETPSPPTPTPRGIIRLPLVLRNG